MWKEFSKADNMSVFEIKNKQFLLKLSKSLAYYKKKMDVCLLDAVLIIKEDFF